MIVRRTTELLDINEEGARLLKSSRDALVGTLLVNHYPVEVCDTVLKWFNQPFDSPEGTVSGEYILGGQRWQSRGRRVPMADGDEGIICVSQPRTDLIPLARLQEMIGIYRDRAVPLGPIAALTDREFEVAALLSASLTDSEIASELHRSIRTVHAHRRSIGQKLGLRRRSEVAEMMRSRGLAASPVLHARATEDDLARSVA
ncbi:MAG: LuxR C-terminal-related transcriptional regulator [Phycisphaerales bacterium]|nr:LuxR C-terminal-related transcriptional regulator [Phycisphaerales bacterium]